MSRGGEASGDLAAGIREPIENLNRPDGRDGNRRLEGKKEIAEHMES